MRFPLLIAGELAGEIDLSGSEPLFRYSEEYIKKPDALPLSAAFPLTKLTAGGEPLQYWLEGLLPDDPEVISALCSENGIDEKDRLLLLGTPMGADCAGAVQICPYNKLPEVLADTGSQEIIDEQEICDWLERMEIEPIQRAYRSVDADSGFSIGGMQPKVALKQTAAAWAVPRGATPSTHIIKATREKWPHESVVEHLTMQTASGCGIMTASTTVDCYGDREVIIVERFDRTADGTSRTHQEDLCQILGHPPRRKYQRNNGPAPEDVATMFREVCPDEADLNIVRFLDHLLFLWVVADTDGHAKNYSVLHSSDGSIHLSPMYDACSWLPYRKNKFVKKIQLAMKFGTDFSLKTADTVDAFIRTADRLKLSPEIVANRASKIASAVPDALTSALSTVPKHTHQYQEVQTLLADLPDRAQKCLTVAESALSHFSQSTSQFNRVLSSVAPAAPQSTLSERCQHIGVRNGKQCVRPVHDDKRHWYQ